MSGASAYDAYSDGLQPYPQYQQPQGYEYGAVSKAARSAKTSGAANIPAVLIGFFGPWCTFVIVHAVLSFSLHYESSSLCYLVCLVCLLFVVIAGLLGLTTWRRSHAGGKEPTWYVFLFITGLIAWVAAFVLGTANYRWNTYPYYEVTNMNVYPSVDPRTVPGQQLMDAGRIIFKGGSKLNLGMAMGFRNTDVYCVAPIVNGDTMMPNYDFWAVGTNCCSGQHGDFHCGEYMNPEAQSGLRLMREDQQGFFRLAVQQAEAAYNIKAPHPIFMTWMSNPVTEVHAYMDSGLKAFIAAVATHFAVQFFFTAVCLITVAKMGQY